MSPLFPVMKNGKKGITKVYGIIIKKIWRNNMETR